MIRSAFFIPNKPARTDISPDEFPRLARNRRGLLWVDFSGETPEASLPILESFKFHPLAIDDALQEIHSPKVDDWGEYIYIVLNYMMVNPEDWEAMIDELDIFVGRNYIVTHHDQPMDFIDEVWNLYQRDTRHAGEGADHLLYRLADNLVTHYMPIVEQVDEALDEIEDQLFARPSPATLQKLFTLKRILLTMRRVTLPQREVLSKLARDDFRVIDPRDRIFFRDIYDHLVRIHDLNESLRDLVGSVLDTYLSVVNNRMNEVMKTLTIITTLFMPITFITGFFGMNFFEPAAQLLGWTSKQAFVLMLAVTAMVPIIMYTWMRRRTWV
ncbi:MAG: magnesium/cobalt transporter CorA [Anaerolineales bacterium]|nr:magnesium/cobalt transporter CorA [Anaerolineales bacterium]